MKQLLITFLLFVLIVEYGFSQITVNSNIIQPTCQNSNNGGINISISGGQAPYVIEWKQNDVYFSNNQNLANITIGTYSLSIIDDLGDNFADTLYVSSLSNISVIDTITNSACYGSLGTINLHPSGGMGFYTGILYPLQWNTWQQVWLIDSLLIDTLQTNLDTLNLYWTVKAGRYVVYISDAIGCSIMQTIEITQPTSQLSFNKTFQNITCKGDSTGWIQIVADGGTSPYYFNWLHGTTTALVNNLKAGDYRITVRDRNGCVKVETISITEPFQPLLTINKLIDVSCRDNKDGSVEVLQIENGLPPYIYLWSNDLNTPLIENLDSGIYALTVTDANNCHSVDTFKVGFNDCDCIIIYNVITPDGNGKNDTWIIKNIHLYPSAEVQVFNRWGKLVYSKSNGYDDSWDGDDLDSGDYYYVVNLKFENYPPYTGTLKILK